MDTRHPLEVAIEQTTDLFAVLDGDGKYVYCNTAYARALGERETLRGSSSLSDIHPEDRTMVRELMSRWQRGTPPRVFEYRMIDQHAQVHFCEGRLESIEDVLPGLTRGFIFVSRFVSAAGTHDAQATVSTENKLRNLLDALHEGIVLIDSAGVVTFVNEHAAAIFGFLPSALIGKSASRVLPAEVLRDSAVASPAGQVTGTPSRTVVFRKSGRADMIQEVRTQQFQEQGMQHPSTLVLLYDVQPVRGDQALH